MYRKTITIALVVLLMAGAASTAGCGSVWTLDDLKVTNETRQVPLDGAKRILADVEMGVGDLALSGDATTSAALTGDFTYVPVALKPQVTYAVAADTGRLCLRQWGLAHNVRVAANTWDVHLPGGLPTDLSLKLGVGRSDIDLRSVDLRSLSVLAGVGETTVDLSGARSEDLDVRIEEGYGDLTLRLPRNVGVRVSAHDRGTGRTFAEGFNLRSDGWVNEAYANTGPKIEVVLNRIGNVTFVLVD